MTEQSCKPPDDEPTLPDADPFEIIAWLNELVTLYAREICALRRQLADERRRSAMIRQQQAARGKRKLKVLQRFINDFDRQKGRDDES